MPKFKVKCNVRIRYHYRTQIEAETLKEAEEIIWSHKFHDEQFERSFNAYDQDDFDLDIGEITEVK